MKRMLRFKRLNNESGMILMMVLMIVIVLMILSASIVTTSLNQNLSIRAQIDEIRKDQVAMGEFLKDQTKNIEDPVNFPMPAVGSTTTRPVSDFGKTYNVIITTATDQDAQGNTRVKYIYKVTD